jgi:heterodisulfide reductase subunit A
MTSALSLADQGFEVHLVEKGPRLGGNLVNIFHTIEGIDVQEVLRGVIEHVTGHGRIHLHMDSEVIASEGSRGNFLTEIMTAGLSEPEEIRHGIVILATGASELKPLGHYLFGEDERVMTQLALEKALNDMSLPEPKECVMIQCVGSRNEKRPYCSRTCCVTALKNAMSMKKRWPDAAITIMFRDMMTYGFLEKYYPAARRMGIRFLRFAPEDPPVVEASENALHVRCTDVSLHEVVTRRADRVVLAAASIPNVTGSLAGVFKLPRTRKGSSPKPI